MTKEEFIGTLTKVDATSPQGKLFDYMKMYGKEPMYYSKKYLEEISLDVLLQKDLLNIQTIS